MRANYTLLPDGSLVMRGAEGMTLPVQCRFCGDVHDGSKVTVEVRYADCSCWRCPGCGVLIDDRPQAWGGSAFPVKVAKA